MNLERDKFMTLEFPLSQGWSKGLTLKFENSQDSKNLNLENIFHVKQIHSNEIVEVTEKSNPTEVSQLQADGLWAQGSWLKEKGVTLLVKSADCCPLLYVDRVNQVIVAIHAGWKGLAKGIHRRPFDDKFLDPKSTWIWLGPCLNGNSFEVRQDLWNHFEDYKNKSEIFSPHKISPEQKYFHVWRYLEKEFEKLGVPLLYNVEVNTFEKNEFHSFRREKLKPQPVNYSWIKST